ncbi:DUF6801 domain-containing protein [Phycicoccus sp. DTK01]|uniref:DUF6801 domain-containing protein n=1 Tax=Phycicoccus sp. DTK01 TaxID=2785745 RepID=UPI001A908C57|nr:DUF6801 domain-containing protein [Phycicoccus sp. DTK01]GIL35297.1 hypothetical protein PDTK01_13730 [Phycicoccus sp. DTK01]
MSTLLHTTVRAALVGGLAVLATAGAATSAQARSGDLTYTCDVRQDVTGGPDFSTTFSARFDSPVRDDGTATAPAGSGLSLDPFTGTVVLSEQAADVLRDHGTTEASVGASLVAAVAEDPQDTATDIDLRIPDTAVPETGPMTLQVRNDDPGIRTAVRRGPNTLVADSLTLNVFDAGGTDDLVLNAECRLVDEGDVSFDRLTGTAAATATPTETATADPSTTASPVRPGLVQTDDPEDEGTPLLPAALLGAAALTAAALGARSLRSAATRRH